MGALLAAVLLVAAAEDSPSVSRLIRQLGADTRKERDAASLALETLGGSALDSLHEALSSSDAEIRRRAKRLVANIERKLFHEIRLLQPDAGPVNGVAFSPDGRRAASVDSRGVRLWDLNTGKELARNEDHGDRVMCVAFSPNGKLVATGSDDRTARIWEATRLTERHVLRQHQGPVRTVSFSPDGNQLLTGGWDGRMLGWNVATGVLDREHVGQPCFSLAPLPDGRRLVSAWRGQDLCQIWKAGFRDPLSLRGHLKQVVAVAVSRDGKKLVTGSHDMTLRSWEVETQRCLHVLKGHTAEVNSVAVSPDGRWAVSGGHDKGLRLWDLRRGTFIYELRGHTGPIWSVAISPDGTRALTGSHDGTLRLWSIGR